MGPPEYTVDRDNLVRETIAAISGDNSIRIDVWFEGQFIAYFAVTVSDPTGSPIGRLDCAHGTVHTHFWGHTVTAKPGRSVPQSDLSRLGLRDAGIHGLTSVSA